MQKIVVLPLDGSERAEQALPQALAQLRPSLDRLVLVQVVDQALAGSAHTYLGTLADRLRGEGWQVDLEARPGHVVETILQVVRERGATLLVASSQGRTGLARWMLGSVAENVARRCPCPVWLVRSQLEPAALPEKPLVLLPLDGSPEAEAGLEFARLQLADVQARLLLVGVCDLPSGTECARRALRNLLESYLSREVARLRERSWVAEFTVLEGPAAAAILEVSAQRRPDLLVMFSHGRTGVSRWLTGSVAERVLRHALCPVVIVPQAAEASFAY